MVHGLKIYIDYISIGCYYPRMREYIVQFDAIKHSAMVNGVYIDDVLGQLQLSVLNMKPSILDIINLDTHGYVATFTLGLGEVNLILNEATGQCYEVEYSQRHHAHTFPTVPPVTITLVDAKH